MSKMEITCPLCGFRAFVDRRLELRDWQFITGSHRDAVCPACVKDQTQSAIDQPTLKAAQARA
jgi:hypothetical protein